MNKQNKAILRQYILSSLRYGDKVAGVPYKTRGRGNGHGDLLAELGVKASCAFLEDSRELIRLKYCECMTWPELSRLKCKGVGALRYSIEVAMDGAIDSMAQRNPDYFNWLWRKALRHHREHTEGGKLIKCQRADACPYCKIDSTTAGTIELVDSIWVCRDCGGKV